MLDLLVVGAGLAGCFAAYTAARAGLKTAIIARGLGVMHFCGGTIDVLGYYPGTREQTRRPLEALSSLASDCPEHPYARLKPGEVSAAVGEFVALSKEIGLPYSGAPTDGENLLLPTAVGASRPTFLAPEGQLAGDLTRPEPMVIVGFTGLRDMYPQLIATNLLKQGHMARAEYVPLGLLTDRDDYSTVHLAAELDRPGRRARLGRELARVLRPGERIGLPAVLGLDQHASVLREVSASAGAPIFEIPMLPPSVPGLRLWNGLRQKLVGMGVTVEVNMNVTGINLDHGSVNWLETETSGRPMRHRARRFLLATGGLISGGIEIDSRGQATETVCGLPVEAPAGRDNWFRTRFLDPAGHPLFSSGIRVNERYQPVGHDGVPVFENVYAAGVLLAGADPILERSLEGIALVTGRAAALAAAS
ncbi:MAG: glycerol-3-phosphate dehydrogenase subunit GlpB [Rudaea sp.]